MAGNGWATITVLDRIADQFVVGDGCWPWTGRLDDKGYPGAIRHEGQKRRPYQLLYELMIGPIPNGLTLDHLCHSADPFGCVDRGPCPHRRCVNPGHLEPVTQAENNRRNGSPWQRRAHQTECEHGHIFDEANTCIARNGTRSCRTCHREHEAARRAEHGDDIRAAERRRGAERRRSAGIAPRSIGRQPRRKPAVVDERTARNTAVVDHRMAEKVSAGPPLGVLVPATFCD